EDLRPTLHNLEILSNAANEDVKHQLKSAFYPFQNVTNAQNDLKRKIENWWWILIYVKAMLNLFKCLVKFINVT
ncbi:17807_t:CDS:1, partial [Funneliformis geosporum]